MPQHTPAPTPSRAVYGFVLYLSFEIFFIAYFIWAIVPDEYFESIGITFLPQRYWAVAVPIYLLIVLTVFAFVIYPAMGWYMTPGADDLRTIQDDVGSKTKRNVTQEKVNEIKATECICKDKETCCREYYNSVQSAVVDKSIPRLRDIDMWEVSENLYLR